MRYAVMLERLPDAGGMPGFYYAHLPSLGLTTHGQGMEGALDAARDLVSLWIEEKREPGEDGSFQNCPLYLPPVLS